MTINIQEIITIVAIVFGVFVAAAVFIPYLMKKGVDMTRILEGTTTTLETADVVVEGLQEFYPENEGLKIADKIIEHSKTAAKAAEQVYKAGLLEADERNAYATEIVYTILEMAKIDIDDGVRRLVDGCIEAAVRSLPKTNVPAVGPENE